MNCLVGCGISPDPVIDGGLYIYPSNCDVLTKGTKQQIVAQNKHKAKTEGAAMPKKKPGKKGCK